MSTTTFTESEVTDIINNHRKLLDLAEQFVEEKHPLLKNQIDWDEIRFDSEYEYIEVYVNTACHCHPEYSWEVKGNISEFVEWLNKTDDT